MEDKQIVELYFARAESAVAETKKKYGRYYLNDILYDKVTYVEDFVPDYGTGLSSMYYQEEKYIEVLAQINSQKGCYLLETESEKSYGTLAMYVIGDTYYFFRFFENGTVMRIHAGTVSE